MQTAEQMELAGSEEAVQQIIDGYLHDGIVGQVGLELEAHCVDPADPARRPGWAELTAIVESLPVLPGQAVPSIEPGGALELSGPPADGAATAIAAMAADHAVLRAACAQAGLGLVLLGADPLRPPRRIHPGRRYRAMECCFRALGHGTDGAAMMTSTAALQVNVDAGPRSGWPARLWLAHALGPVMIAITANSPMLGGARTGAVSERRRIWGRLDPARCAPVPDGADGWARYALGAPVLAAYAPDADGTGSANAGAAAGKPVTFADWADGRVRLHGRRPTADDLDEHLSTLFPPVRPRGWLEIRYLDAVPHDLWPAVVFTLATLLDDPLAAGRAAEAVEPVAGAWTTAARIGLADPALHTAVTRCVTVAAERAPSSLQPAMAGLVDRVEQRRCPADDFTDRVADAGLPAALAELARDQP
ncbi:glutamate--cysteine ligase EgtA [Mycolicibacterium insubricum]|jgi:glutamate--cysteine ligase|uniref:Glutamate--cysteine ligase EgtA n=1 Tax=Mycolicibacterium insubricum TaxID=444597 RepID=A0A1X0DEH1_9MYCO|nr:ergothioneine biosynthesis glutamate--cysteine ligase EgtA [Mycolicibacterium insubricum]MCB9439898.1 ergothioneine biosynthesis glutamate--cysteine ligase EgtA [Mycolicibacterium sp.]ORA70589.1 ergothioneine biosynthesis glutamate--cysteine ligase EgtA [Mycolicibacterium insubricum]BBZ66703.1 glutamate--cysteine ligase EgtA [Mycolicibacterium insubricum]